MISRGRPALLATLFLCAQVLLAWHLPSHLSLDDDHPLQVISAQDCDVCLPMQGTAPLPAITTPVAAPEVSWFVADPLPGIVTRPLIPGAGPRAPPVLS